jgi:hypothetical protein
MEGSRLNRRYLVQTFHSEKEWLKGGEELGQVKIKSQM